MLNDHVQRQCRSCLPTKPPIVYCLDDFHISYICTSLVRFRRCGLFPSLWGENLFGNILILFFKKKKLHFKISILNLDFHYLMSHKLVQLPSETIFWFGYNESFHHTYVGFGLNHSHNLSVDILSANNRDLLAYIV